jgi:hypothetical protein
MSVRKRLRPTADSNEKMHMWRKPVLPKPAPSHVALPGFCPLAPIQADGRNPNLQSFHAFVWVARGIQRLEVEPPMTTDAAP